MSLSPDDYERLRRATRTHREELVLRLCGEAGLRPAEQARIRPGDLFDHEGATMLSVFTAERTDESAEPARETVLPERVARDLRKYVASNDIEDGDPLFSVSARRLAMLVGEVVDRTDGVDASVTALRRQFAARLLDAGARPQTVVELGGWERLDSLAPVLPDPEREDLVRAVTDSGRNDHDRLEGTDSGLAGNVLAAAAALSDSLAGAADRDAVAARGCEHLAGVEGVRFAWLAERVGDAFTVQGFAGMAERTLREHVDGHRNAMHQAVADGTPRTVNGANGPVVVTPVTAGDADGVLALGVSTAPGETATDAIAGVAGQLGHTLTAVERKRLLLADAVVELDFRCPASASFVADLSAALDCRVELSGVVPVGEPSLLYYLTVEGAGAEPVLSHATAADAVEDARVLKGYGDGASVEVVVTETPALTLIDAGGRVRSLTASDGVATLTAELAGDTDVRGVVDTVTGAAPGVGLLAKRRTDRPTETATGFRERLSDRLSERQATVLRAAYHAGYFEWPRDTTAEELADSVGVSSPTLHNHLRKAEGKLLTAFFEDLPPREEQ